MAALLACGMAMVASSSSGGRLAVSVGAPTSPAYNVTVDGRSWLPSAATWYQSGGSTFSTADGSLTVASRTPISGTDANGAYDGFSWTYTAGGKPSEMATSVRVYADAGVAIFSQTFPAGVKSSSLGGDSDGILSSFPSFVAEAWPDKPRGVVSFQGDMTGDGTRTGAWGAAALDTARSAAPAPPSAVGMCRVTTVNANLARSRGGFSAWTVASGGNPRQYTEHPGDYCDCTGLGSCEHWPFHSGGLTQADCQAKCDSLNCSCFDFSTGGGGGGGKGVIGSGKHGSGPVVIFDSPDAATSLVLSAHNNFMVASQVAGNGTLAYGVMGSVEEIPPQFALETVVVLSSGVNQAMDAWGDVLLSRSGKQRDAYRRDFATQWLGYSTDNGAYYYYQTEPGKNYEDTLLDVHNYAKQVAIPYKYVLLDSWWYFKGEGGGVATWDPRPDVFPEGALGPFYEKTGWIGQLHNRYWSTDTPYATRNGGKYNFVFDGSKVTCPEDQTFWDELIANKSTGAEKMFMYEQDWLDDEFDNMGWLTRNATAASTWLHQMNEGCRKSNVTIQYCMSHVRHILQSTELEQVTNARASGDYHPGSSQWNIGTTSILAHAVGIAPSKDNYWSTEKQNGTHYGKDTAEPHSALQSAVLSLSDGPVCPSDAVGRSNASLILRACDVSGRLLRPDRSAAAIDDVFTSAAFGGSGALQGQVWLTHANVSGARYGYVLVPQLADAYSLGVAKAGYGAGDTLVAVHHADVGAPETVDAARPLSLTPCDPSTFDLVTLSPVLGGGWALLGEPDKWVSVSPQRFSGVTASASKATAVASGPPGEKVTVAWRTPGAGATTVSAQCTVGASGTVTVTATASPPGASC